MREDDLVENVLVSEQDARDAQIPPTQRVTVVLTPQGALDFLPIHKGNAARRANGQGPVRCVINQGRCVRIEIRPEYAAAGYHLYREWLAAKPDGAKYAEMLDEVITMMNLDIDGLPQAELPKEVHENRDKLYHPDAIALRSDFVGARRISPMTDRLRSNLGITDATPPRMSEDERKAAVEAFRRQAPTASSKRGPASES